MAMGDLLRSTRGYTRGLGRFPGSTPKPASGGFGMTPCVDRPPCQRAGQAQPLQRSAGQARLLPLKPYGKGSRPDIMTYSALDLLRGTLDLLILRTLLTGPRHGYAIAESILRDSDDELLVEEGALYPALHRLAAKGWVESEWGVSDNNRRARYYAITPAGRRQLRAEVADWERYVRAVGRVLKPRPAGPA